MKTITRSARLSMRTTTNTLLGAVLFLLVIGATAPRAHAQCVPVPPGAVAWWRGDANASDSGGSNHGTLHNGTTFVAGKASEAFSFDGVNDYIEVPDHPSLRIGDVISIEFWAKRQRFGIDIVVEKGGDWNLGVGDPGANYGIGLHEVNNNMVYFYFKDGWRGADGVSDFDFHHYAVVAVQGQPNPIFYIDGVERPSLYAGGVSSIDLNAASTLPLHIGAQANDPQGYDYYGNNIIDELAIFNRALTAAEVQSIYAAGSAGKCASPECAAEVQQPINADGSSTFNGNRGVVPVKFRLTCDGQPTCDLPPATIAVTRTVGGVIGGVNESVYSSQADSGANFRILNCQYHYNLNSGALGVGTYRVDILIEGQVVGSATFQLE